MTGKYNIIVRNNKIQFTIEIERNITIIQGESGSGKTTLVDLIAMYSRYGKSSGVTVNSKVNVTVCSTDMWDAFIDKTHNSIIFIDEGNDFVQSAEFAKAVKASDCYFVIVTRENLDQLPYSVKSILKLRKTASRSKITFNRTYPVYENLKKTAFSERSLILTEDKGSGNEMFTKIAADYNCKCISADGKSNIKAVMSEHLDDHMIIVADGSAFGADMADVYKLVCQNEEKLFLYLPESLEWLILSSDIVRINGLKEILNAPWEYIESSEFVSWERYFTSLLESATKGTPLQYSKSRLAKAYLSDENIKKIVDTIITDE